MTVPSGLLAIKHITKTHGSSIVSQQVKEKPFDTSVSNYLRKHQGRRLKLSLKHFMTFSIQSRISFEQKCQAAL
jgi:hypothetical protein